MTTIQAVVIDKNSEVIALLDIDPGKEIEIAGAISIDGSPVNRKSFKVSSSKANLTKAAQSDAQFATRHEHKGFVFYTLNA